MSQWSLDSFCKSIQKVGAEYPNRTAVEFCGNRVSYARLLARAGQIANALVASGALPGDRVGMHVGRSDEMVAAMLGILFARCAYVPLDPMFPAARLAHIVLDSGIRHVLYRNTLSLNKQPEICLDLATMRPYGPDEIDLAPRQEPSAEDIAYVMYTSGSTGVPKGVMVHHGAVSNFLASMCHEPGINANDRLLAITTPSFDISVLEIFLPLTVGGCVVVASAEEIRDGAALAELVESGRISVMQATPASWKLMLAAGWMGSMSLKALCGGEPLDVSLASQLTGRVKELWNMYGPTETTVWSTCCRIAGMELPISVGKPILNTTLHVLDDTLRPVPIGEVGELFIGGLGVATGYTNPDLTRERFISNPFTSPDGRRLYRTGDSASLLPDGSLRILGRRDDQVKIRGYRIELEEIRHAICIASDVQDASVVVKRQFDGEPVLVGFVVLRVGVEFDPMSLRDTLRRSLPEYMVPATLVELESLPLTPNGKIDRKALATLDIDTISEQVAESSANADPVVAFIADMAKILNKPDIPHTANLFDLGLDSLKANLLVATLSRRLGRKISVAKLFAYPTLASFMESAGLIASKATTQATVSGEAVPEHTSYRHGSIAIIGAAGRFPGADTLDAFWAILDEGRETITRFTAEQDDPLIELNDRMHPGYVRARGLINQPEMFDASFFGIPPNDAAAMDPQQRVFLEVAWEAMENAGHDPTRFAGEIGVYAGMGNNFYYHYNVSTRPDLIRMIGEVQAEIGREKDHIATLVSHKLNLTGPSISVHTACSTGLVAIDTACGSLMRGDCDMALAGAIELRTPQMSGQIHEPGGIFTEDGHCRPFSDNASGTMFSDGAGVVVLRRLEDALADGDRILGVISGSAVNHDGANKKSYLAPSVQGQMQVIEKAHRRAGVRPNSISYIEAHGTATPVGDPIEFEALRNVFEADTDEKGFCALGSVKANLGHPTTAAGVVGVIKLCLALQHKRIPPLINFRSINPNIDIDNSPFHIPLESQPWKARYGAHRAAISSFGFCGTNAHVVIEGAPQRQSDAVVIAPRPYQLLVLSAATETALHTHACNVASTLMERPCDVANAANTLAIGRAELRYRSFMVWRGNADSPPDLTNLTVIDTRKRTRPKLAFAFSGQGAQYAFMGKDLYRTEPNFKAAFDACAMLIAPHLGEDLRDMLVADAFDEFDLARAQEKLADTRYTQPAIFCLEYALAKLWLSWGIRPDMLVGHSIGEFACAVIADIMSLEDAASLIVLRGRLMAGLPRGAMLAVRKPAKELNGHTRLSVAALNGPGMTVMAGPEAEIDALARTLIDAGERCQRLRTSHAFHSWMMDSAVGPFHEAVSRISLRSPTIPIISTVTGKKLRNEEAMDPSYWANHMREPVRFADALATLWEADHAVILEIGPRNTLASLAGGQRRVATTQIALSSLTDNSDHHAESEQMMRALGQLWTHGICPDWAMFQAERGMRKAVLPTYPFERKRHWIMPAYLRCGDAVASSSIEPTGLTAPVSDTPPVDTAALVSTSREERVLNQLLEIFKEVSGEPLTLQASTVTFPELGLDSLLLTPVAFLIKERLHVAVTFRQLTSELNTPMALAAYLVREQPASSSSASDLPDEESVAQHDIAVEVVDRPLFLTPGQHAMIAQIREERDVDASRAVSPEVAHIRIDGMLDMTTVEQAIKSLVTNHPVLSAHLGDGGLVYLNQSPESFSVQHVLTRRDEINAMIREEMLAPLPSSEGWYFRAIVLTSGALAHDVVFVVHGLLCDGWSLDVLIEDFCRGYRQLSGLQSSPLPAANSPVQFEKFLSHWMSEVEQRSHVPADTSGEAVVIAGRLKEANLNSLRNRAMQAQASPFVLYLAAIENALCNAEISSVGNVVFQMAGQPLANLLRLVGQYASWVRLPAPVAVAHTHTNHASLDALKAVLTDAQDSLARALAGRFSDLHIGQLSSDDVAVIYTKRLPAEVLAIDGLDIDYVLRHPLHQIPRLIIHLLEYPSYLEVSLAYRRDKMDPNMVAHLRDDLLCALDTIGT